MNSFLLGFKTYFNSFRFIRQKGLMYFYLFPIAIVILLSFLISGAIANTVDTLSQIINHSLGLEQVHPENENFVDTLTWWLSNAGKYTLRIVLYIGFYFLYYKLLKYVVLILMSPVMAFISERTEAAITGEKYTFNFTQLLKDTFTGMRIALRNLIIELTAMLLIWLIGLSLSAAFLPILLIYTPLAGVFLFALSAYFFGFSTIDYNTERWGFSYHERISFIRRNYGLSLSNGLFFALWLMLPVVGTLIATVSCTVAATMACYEIKTKQA